MLLKRTGAKLWVAALVCFATSTCIAGPNLYVSDYSRGIAEYDGATGQYIRNIAPFGFPCYSVKPRFRADGRFFESEIEYLGVHEINLQTGSYTEFHTGGTFDLASDFGFMPNGDIVTVEFGNGSMRRYSGVTGNYLSTIPPRRQGAIVQSPVAGSDGYLYTQGSAGVERRDGNTGDFIGMLPGPNVYGSLIQGPNGTLYCANQIGGWSIEVWDPVANTYVGRLATLPSGFSYWDLAFGPGGDLLVIRAQVAGARNTDVIRLDARTGEFLGTFISGHSLYPGSAGLCYGPVPEPPGFLVLGACLLAASIRLFIRR